MFRIAYLAQAALFAIVQALPIGLARLALALSTSAIAIFYFWIGMQSNIAMGLITGLVSSGSDGGYFIELKTVPLAPPRVAMTDLTPQTAERMATGPVWLLAQGQQGLVGAIPIVEADLIRHIDAKWLVMVWNALPRLPEVVLLSLAAATCLFNQALRAAICAGATGLWTFLAAWGAAHLFLADPNGVGAAMSSLWSAALTASFVAALALRVVLATPSSFAASGLAAMCILSALFVMPNLFEGPNYLPVIASVLVALVPALLTAIPAAVMAQHGLGWPVNSILPLIMIAILAHLLINWAIAKLDPQRGPSRSIRRARTWPARWRKEPMPQNVDSQGRFLLSDLFEGVRA